MLNEKENSSVNQKKSVISYLKLAHWLGLTAVLLGTGTHYFTNFGSEVSGMTVIASLIGIGLVMMSPFPIALFIQWAQKQDASKG